TEIFHAGQRIRRCAVVGRIKFAHFVVSLWAMGNNTRSVEVTVVPPTVAPLGGDDKYATAAPASVDSRISDAPQYLDGFHIKRIDHGKRISLHIHAVQYNEHRLVE